MGNAHHHDLDADVAYRLLVRENAVGKQGDLRIDGRCPSYLTQRENNPHAERTVSLPCERRQLLTVVEVPGAHVLEFLASSEHSSAACLGE